MLIQRNLVLCIQSATGSVPLPPHLAYPSRPTPLPTVTKLVTWALQPLSPFWKRTWALTAAPWLCATNVIGMPRAFQGERVRIMRWRIAAACSGRRSHTWGSPRNSANRPTKAPTKRPRPGTFARKITTPSRAKPGIRTTKPRTAVLADRMTCLMRLSNQKGLLRDGRPA
ncbi:hypothetical protein ACU18_02160 [Arthrobacter sp. ZBG10]|nr:hypothetical protein ACU18_02160 [Arthrobacter sp. ZBG10]